MNKLGLLNLLLCLSMSFATEFFTTSNVSIDANDAQWELKKSYDGIDIYTRMKPGESLKELKMELVLESTNLNKVINVLNNTKGYEEWVYKCMEAKNIDNANPLKSIDYYKFDFPRPMYDREVYSQSTMTQDPISRKLTIETTTVNDFPLTDKNVVRIENHYNRWELTPIVGNKVDLVYYAYAEPGGSIPNWIINKFIVRGPLNTMLKFRETLDTAEDPDQKISWLKE